MGYALASTASAATANPQTGPSAACAHLQGMDLTYDEIVGLIRPPDWDDQAVTITMGGADKLILRTDGDKKFELVAGEPVQPGVYTFLIDLDNSCQLPPDPEAAAELVKMRWETKEISRAQFEQLHRDFTAALAQYATRINATYDSIISTHLVSTFLDAGLEMIVYDNQTDHVEVRAWNIERDRKSNPILEWAHEFSQFAADTFHRPYRGY
jgi:hypothetical protein